MAISQFAGQFNAASYAYGVVPTVAGLPVLSGPSVTGSGTLVLAFGGCATSGGATFSPLNVNAPITVGGNSAQETVTPTAVSTATPLLYGTTTVTATFASVHGAGDTVRSGTVGLQEAINACAGYGGGDVTVDAGWTLYGGTSAMIAAAVLPFNVKIIDRRYGSGATSNQPSSVTALAAPTALTTAASTNGMITAATTGGTISNATYRLGVTYVDQFGGETTLSVDTASTATIATTGTTSTITVTSPAAETGAVGYRVYMSAAAGASLSEILYPVGNAAITGTAVVIPAGSPVLPSFAIGTPVVINAIITGTAKIPAQNSAYAGGAQTVSQVPVQSYPPFTALGTIAAAATGTVGQVNLPAGFLNVLGRTMRVKGMLYATTNGTGGTITLEHILSSIYGVTSITPFTAATSSVAASAIAVSMIFEVLYVTAATGATGTLECHGFALYNVAGTAVATGTMDNVITVSSAVDLTKQLTLSVAHLNTTLGTTVSQLRQLTIEVL